MHNSQVVSIIIQLSSGYRRRKCQGPICVLFFFFQLFNIYALFITIPCSAYSVNYYINNNNNSLLNKLKTRRNCYCPARNVFARVIFAFVPILYCASVAYAYAVCGRVETTTRDRAKNLTLPYGGLPRLERFSPNCRPYRR